MKKSHDMEGEEKSRYLGQLDLFLSTLVNNFRREDDFNHLKSLEEFGSKNKWDLTRLPSDIKTYQDLAFLIDRVRQEYRLFDWIESENVEENRGYFDRISVSANSGLPWVFDFKALQLLKEDCAEKLFASKDYAALNLELEELLTKDLTEQDQVRNKVQELAKEAQKRNYLEHLLKADLLGNESTTFSMEPRVKKVLSMGGETLWNISYIRFSPASNKFQVYVIDTWQDIMKPEIIEVDDDKGKLSDNLKKKLIFSDQNAAWYVLQDLDRSFESLHPVHVSIALIGPFENKYLTDPEHKILPVTNEVLASDANAGLLRFTRRYSYAPNHVEKGEKLEQVVYQEKWHDEVIVCPSSHSSKLSQSLQGTNLRIFEVEA